MKKIFYLAALICLFLYSPVRVDAASVSLAQKLQGRILLQVESYGRAWYVNPVDSTRYYLKDGEEAYELMRTQGLGITNTDLAQIPTRSGQPFNEALTKRLLGRILLQVEEHGEAWYVNPVDKLRYYLKDGEAAYLLMRTQALGIKNSDLKKIPINDSQLVQDTTFNDVAYALLRDPDVVTGKNIDQILSPASMSKLMTALVLFDDTALNWDQLVTITQSQINYPQGLVGNDQTSEIELQVGDIVSVYDLWVAMLMASSNQATIALVDNSGKSRAEFVSAMNKKSVALGLRRTIFYEPTGLDAHNVTTAREMAIIAREAFSRSAIAEATRQDGYVISTRQSPPRAITIVDRNFSLQLFKAEAAKTGFLVEAQRCVAFKKDDSIIVVMHARSMSERNTIITNLLKK